MADFRGRSPVLLALFRGLYCPFCRRNIAQLGLVSDKLTDLGVASLGVVATTLQNARLYVRYRPARFPLAADPDLVTHRAYGAPHPPVTPEFTQALSTVTLNPWGVLPKALPVMEVVSALNALDGHAQTETDGQDNQRQFPQLQGQFLIDREGIVRWANIEGERAGLAGLGTLPAETDILAAARALA